jgi:Heterokaryon incompatibility protein (HET)
MAFSYLPLEENNAIRLLTIERGSQQEVLQCNLNHAQLDGKKSPYEALSYAWDGDTKTCKIEVNGGEVMITPTLDSALRHLRLLDGPRTIWADAICINQGDSAEKGSQVSLMAQIYKSASRVVVFLGDERQDSTLAVRKLEEMASKFTEDILASWQTSHARHTWTDQFEYIRLMHPNRDTPQAAEAKAIRALFGRPWFSRMWVLQEVVLSRDVVVQCGEAVIPFRTLRRAVTYIMCENVPLAQGILDSFSLYSDTKPRTGLENFLDLIQLLEIYESGRTVSLSTLLEKCRNRQSSLTRDRLFALLSLVQDHGIMEFKPDYGAPLECVVESFFIKLLANSGSIRLLEQSGLSSQPTRFPSWVPNWVGDETTPSTGDETFTYHASGNTSQPYLGFNVGVLTVHASRFDVISEILQIPMKVATDITIFRPIEEFFNRKEIYPTGELMEDVKWRTVVQNRNVDDKSSPAPSSYAEDYRRAIRYAEWIEGIHDDKLDDDFRASVNMKRHMRAGRALAWTKQGYAANVPLRTRPSDLVYIVAGARAPFILRSGAQQGGQDLEKHNLEPAMREKMYRLVGECYVHGIMNGEALPTLSWDDIDLY